VILSDGEILAAVERGDISITPLPPFNSKLWSSTALDLRLDREVRKWEKIKTSGQLTAISSSMLEFNVHELTLQLLARLVTNWPRLTVIGRATEDFFVGERQGD
jgi:hypothetical protein